MIAKYTDTPVAILMDRSRPVGVTIVAILMIINGALFVGGGIFAILVIPNVINEQFAANQTNITIGNHTSIQLGNTLTGIINTVVIVISSISIAIGVAAFVLSWGLLNGKGWAWIITVILAIISVVFSIIALASGGFTNIVTLVINGAILYYMYRPPVKAYFGRVKIPR
jgi:uncharacterized membrane protein (DUF2068 family)